MIVETSLRAKTRSTATASGRHSRSTAVSPSATCSRRCARAARARSAPRPTLATRTARPGRPSTTPHPHRVRPGSTPSTRTRPASHAARPSGLTRMTLGHAAWVAAAAPGAAAGRCARRLARARRPAASRWPPGDRVGARHGARPCGSTARSSRSAAWGCSCRPPRARWPTCAAGEEAPAAHQPRRPGGLPDAVRLRRGRRAGGLRGAADGHRRRARGWRWPSWPCTPRSELRVAVAGEDLAALKRVPGHRAQGRPADGAGAGRPARAPARAPAGRAGAGPRAVAGGAPSRRRRPVVEALVGFGCQRQAGGGRGRRP